MDKWEGQGLANAWILFLRETGNCTLWLMKVTVASSVKDDCKEGLRLRHTGSVASARVTRIRKRKVQVCGRWSCWIFVPGGNSRVKEEKLRMISESVCNGGRALYQNVAYGKICCQ